MRYLFSCLLILSVFLFTNCTQAPDTSDQSMENEQRLTKKKRTKRAKPKKQLNQGNTTSTDAKKAEIQQPDTYPLFPGCSETDYETRRTCSQAKLIEALHKVIKYPASAIEDKVNGIVVHSFIIEADGSMTNLKLKKSLTPACDEAAFNAIQDLMTLSGPWEPGTLNGKAVSVQYQLPIQFRN